MAKNPDPSTDPSVAEDVTATPEAEDQAPEAQAPAEEPELRATSAGVDLTASPLPEVPTVNTPPAPDSEAAPLTPAEEAVAKNDPTPEQEATPQVFDHPAHIDGSGVLQQTNQEAIDQFPRNDKGQLVIDEDGNIVGL